MFISQESMLTSDRNSQRGEYRQQVVTSRHFTDAHAINYDLENDFCPFIEKELCYCWNWWWK